VQELEHNLLEDLKSIGLNVEFNLKIRKYSKSHFGNYNPNNNTISIYVFADSGCTRMYPYEELFLTLIHEAIHCLLWNDPNHVRVYRVLHDVEWKELYSYYSTKAKVMLLLKEVHRSEEASKDEHILSPV
jgi:hypothetical protein